MDLILELLDVPGQLLSVLEPISSLGANLVTIIHKRDDKNDKGRIPVQITLEGEKENLSLIVNKLSQMDVNVRAIDGVLSKEITTFILIGHIIDTDIKDSMDQINSLKGIEVSNLELNLKMDSKSTAKLIIKSDSGLKDTLIDKVQEIASKKDLFLISEI